VILEGVIEEAVLLQTLKPMDPAATYGRIDNIAPGTYPVTATGLPLKVTIRLSVATTLDSDTTIAEAQCEAVIVPKLELLSIVEPLGAVGPVIKYGEKNITIDSTNVSNDFILVSIPCQEDCISIGCTG